jgi:dipeptidyl aminopeptidase/acylaminoacyl peptidase
MPSIHWLDPQRGSQQRSLSSAFPGRRVVVADRSADGQRIVAIVDSPSQPDVYQLVDFATSRADIVGEAYPELAKVAFGEVRFYSYLARDGADIPTYLTLPPGSDGRNLPLIVLPHGGPESRDYDHFDWLAQFLATRGYAVLQPQFRGSTGFGEAHRRAGYRQWGGRMQDDLTDGVRHLVANGTADPTRVCIVGGSYGGYAALAGAAFTPELYACAASINGISDLPDFVMAKKRQSGEDSDSVAYWADHIGPAMDPNVAAKSPARSAGTVRANVLLMHGIDDSVVPLSQSEKMANALTSAGKPVTFVKMAREDHWLSRSDTRVQVLKELETFLARHLH